MSEELEQRINNRFNRLEHQLGAAIETHAQLAQLIVERRQRFKLIKKPKPKVKKT